MDSFKGSRDPNLYNEWTNLYRKVELNSAETLSPQAESSKAVKSHNVSESSTSVSNVISSLLNSREYERLINAGLRPKGSLLNLLLDAVSIQFAELEKQIEDARDAKEESANKKSSEKNSEILCVDVDIESSSGEDSESIFEESTVTFDRTPPTPKLNGRSLQGISQLSTKTTTTSQNKMSSIDSRKELFPDDKSKKQSESKGCGRIRISQLASSFEITSTGKTKNIWIDPDVKSASSTSSFRSHNKNKSKQYKQQNLLTMTRNMPKKTVDVSTFKEFNGGSRSNSASRHHDHSQTQLASSTNGSLGVKRKSDESSDVPANVEKRDKYDMSTTFFEISPIKIVPPLQSPQNNETVYTSPPSSPSLMSYAPTARSLVVVSPVKQPTTNRFKKPLSPKTSTNVMDIDTDKTEYEHVNEKTNKDKYKLGDAGPSCSKKAPEEDLDSTYNLIKDFDKIPTENSSLPKFKYKQPTVRKKAERKKLQGWDCEECREYYEILESQMDADEIQRIKDRCSRHRSKEAPVSNTPENFWCTYIPTTQELYADGYIKVANTPFTPAPPRKHRNFDSYTDDEENGRGTPDNYT